jgi:hypothetical protein
VRGIQAVGLVSGGLDSMLAIRIMQEQEVEVLGLHFRMPTACCTGVDEVAGRLGIPVAARLMGDDYLRLLRAPRHGYGRNMNPCVDCRIHMFRLARDYMQEVGARFVFTGEVLGQRPMSQMRHQLRLIERESGLTGYVLRPLSARRLPETEPEKRGWVDRSRLLGLAGRGRRPQLDLASAHGYTEYSPPAGGCLLTDANFAGRLRDLFRHAPPDCVGQQDVLLLRLGRHFRLDSGLKVVLGRDAEENRQLLGFRHAGWTYVMPAEPWRGPSALACGALEGEDLSVVAGLLVRYSNPRRIPAEARLSVMPAGAPARAIPLPAGALDAAGGQASPGPPADPAACALTASAGR